MNRIQPIIDIKDDKERYDALYHLNSGFYNNVESPLTSEEIETIINHYANEKQDSKRSLLWHIILRGVKNNSNLKDFAVNYLKDSKDFQRRYSMSYLLWNYPDMFETLKAKYITDDDQGIRFSLAEYIAEKNPQEAEVLMREILSLTDDHDVCDGIQLYLSDWENKRKNRS